MEKNFVTQEIQEFSDSFFKEKTQIHPLNGDAGNRLYFLVESTGGEKHILCSYASEELESFHNFSKIRHILKENDISVPHIYSENEGCGFMLIEYLGHTSLEDYAKKSAKNKINMYTKVINQLVSLQSMKPESIFVEARFTKEIFLWELNFALKHLRGLFSLRIDSSLEKKLQKEFKSLSSKLSSLDEVVTHRDFHSRNLLIYNERPYMIDFQDARMGNPFYDLTSLIEDTYVNLNTPEKEALKDYYCFSKKLSQDNLFEENYNLQALQRSIKACGSFASLKIIHGFDRYLQYLKPSFVNIKTYLEKLNSFAATKDFIDLCIEKESALD